MALAALVSRNAVPVAGILFLGWHAPTLIVLYLIDFIADISLVLALLMLLDPEFRTAMAIPPGLRGVVKLFFGMAFTIGILDLVFAFVFGMPVFGMMVMEVDFSLERLFADPRFQRALATHLLLSSWTYVQAYRFFAKLRAADPGFDVSAPLRGRFQYVVGRWLAVYVAGLALPFFPAAMIVAYCAATVYFEMFPQRLQKFFADDTQRGPTGT